MIIQYFDLNMIPSQAPVVVNVDQYDTGTGRLVISLYEDDAPYTPANASATIQGTKPDGHGFTYSVTLSGNTVTANVTEQMTPVAGDVRTQVVVRESTGRTGTFAFILRVQKSALPEDTDLSESDYTLIEQGIEAAATAVAAASDASGYAETASAAANNSEMYANDASASAQAAANQEDLAEAAEGRAAASAQSAASSQERAQGSEIWAEAHASDSEAYAKGTRNGTAVASTDPAYHNNSEYYAGLSGTSATNALNSEYAAKAAEQNAKASEDILSFYAQFITPHFVIQNNRLYINDPNIGEFVVANNRLYFKLAS